MSLTMRDKCFNQIPLLYKFRLPGQLRELAKIRYNVIGLWTNQYSVAKFAQRLKIMLVVTTNTILSLLVLGNTQIPSVQHTWPHWWVPTVVRCPQQRVFHYLAGVHSIVCTLYSAAI